MVAPVFGQSHKHMNLLQAHDSKFGCKSKFPYWLRSVTFEKVNNLVFLYIIVPTLNILCIYYYMFLF